VTWVVEGAEVLVGGISVVVLACCGWVVASLAALSEISGPHATAKTANAANRARQG
jgi:ABC-type transporter Mla subunit MlaD